MAGQTAHASRPHIAVYVDPGLRDPFTRIARATRETVSFQVDNRRALGPWQKLPTTGIADTLLAIRSERDITTMNVSLPRTQKEFVDQQVQQGSFSTVSDYIRDLIRREQRALAREELERKLVEGLSSGAAREMTPQDWKLLRDGLKRRATDRKDGWPPVA
jgi:antitoxin ParD1/3/4